jgi:hypothetical protein
MRFREEALARSQTQEALDLPVKLTSPRGWIVLVTLAAVVLGGGTWAFGGSLPRAIDARGQLTSRQGIFAIKTVAAGQVVEVFVKRGSSVKKNAPVAVVTDGRSRRLVRSPAKGRIFSLTQVGEVVQVASTLAVAERVDAAANWLVAVLYLPATQGAGVAPGDTVDLTVDSAPVAVFGVLRGRVASVDQLVSSRTDVADFLGDAGLAQALAAGPARRIVVELVASTQTASGYEWSTKAGPPFRLGSWTGVVGAIAQPPLRPAQWVFPR